MTIGRAPDIGVQLAELDQIYQTAPVGLCLIDTDLCYLRVNQKLAEFHGKSIDDHIGQSIFEIIPQIATKVEEIFRRVIDFGEPVLNQEVAAATDATPDQIRYWLASYYPLKAASGGVEAISVVVQEISDIKKVEKDLRESETRYSMATASGSVGLWDWDLVTDEIYVDPILKGLLGYEDDEIRNHIEDWGSHVHPDDGGLVMKAAKAHLAGQTHRYEVEHRMLHKDGTVRWFLARGIAMRNESGEPYRMVGTDTCITNMKIAEHTIQENQQQLKEKALILSQVHDAVISTDMDGFIQTWNEGAEGIYGYTSDEVLGQQINFVEFPEDRESMEAQVLDPFQKHGCFQGVVRNRTKLGDEIFVDLTMTLLRDETGEPIGRIGCSHDITEKRELQEDLLRVVAREQRRIGQELHDTIGQELVGLGFLAQGLLDTLTHEDSAELDSAQSIRHGLDRALSQIRALSRGVIPQEVSAGELTESLADLAARTEELGDVECRFESDATVFAVDDRTATHLYRIAQESVTNALKHGQVGKIAIRLGRSGRELCLAIEDDGIGFDEAERESGMGQRIMAFRAELIGASLEIATDRGSGTTTACRLATD